MVDSDRLYKEVRSRIKKFRLCHPRTQRKTTQIELAQAIGIERSTLANIEVGNQRPQLHVLYGICEYFGIGLRELMPGLDSVRDELPNEDRKVVVGDDHYSLPDKVGSIVEKLRSSG